MPKFDAERALEQIQRRRCSSTFMAPTLLERIMDLPPSLSTVRIENLEHASEIDATLVHFPLHPETPAERRSMAELYAGRNVDPEAMYARMKGLMDAEGLRYGRRTHSYNGRLAHRPGIGA